MKILFAGIIARYPFGGVSWCSLMYLLGLRALGHEVFYIEDTGECIYDPEQDAISLDPSYGTQYIHRALEPFGFGDRWSFVNYDGAYHGASQETVRAYCGDADLFLNLSGGSWFWRDEYARIPRRVFIDSDPVFTQFAIAKGVGWYCDFFRGFDRLFTFGANIGTPDSDVPTGAFTWHKTWQPVITDLWHTDVPHTRDAFTTVMTWKTESFSDVDGNKDREFVRFLSLPGRTNHRFEPAVNGPKDLLRQHGWAPVDAMSVSRSLWDYRDFIQTSKAEFSVAKHAYVAHRSGWFSDRTECYLASGRPARRARHGVERALAFRHGPVELFDAGGGDRRARVHRERLRCACPARWRDRARVFRCIGRPAIVSGTGMLGRPLRIAQVAPVAQSVPPAKSGSIETMTALLVDALVSRGHDVTLFATGSSVTRARLHAVFERGYCEDSSIWPWELCELFNLAAAVEHGAAFDVIHYQAEYSPMSLAFSRLSRNACPADAPPSADLLRDCALVEVSGRAFRRRVPTSGARARRPQRLRRDSSCN